MKKRSKSIQVWGWGDGVCYLQYYFFVCVYQWQYYIILYEVSSNKQERQEKQEIILVLVRDKVTLENSVV